MDKRKKGEITMDEFQKMKATVKKLDSAKVPKEDRMLFIPGVGLISEKSTEKQLTRAFEHMEKRMNWNL
jgi:hypothetical protein